MKKNKYCLLSNDVETTSIWFNKLRDETGETVLREGLPVLLEIYESHDIKSTFFFTGYFARKFPEAVKMVVKGGHEVGSHGYSHEVDQAFDVLNLEQQKDHLRRSKELLEDLSGQEVISFRAPALRVNEFTPVALAETGFKIDSSVASQRFDMFLSFGGLKKLSWLGAPRLPYLTSRETLLRKGEGPIVEVPLAATLLPYTSTTMRIFPFITRLQHIFLNMEAGFNGKPIVFDIHPNELIEEQTGERRTIQRRTRNPIKYLLADVLRGKLKVRNLGKKAIPLYNREIAYFKKKNHRFLTLRDYCKEKGFFS